MSTSTDTRLAQYRALVEYGSPGSVEAFVCDLIARAARADELQAEVARLGGELSRLGTRDAEQVERLTAEKRNQFVALTEIRTLADSVPGVAEEREQRRLPGALGAVTVLVERYNRLVGDK